MNRAANTIFAIVCLCIPVAICIGATSFSGYQFELANGKMVANNPIAQANAAQIDQKSRDAAAMQAIVRQGKKAEADAASAATGAYSLRNILIASGLGTGALILCVGGAFAGIAWLNRRATSVFPNASGQYPVIVKRSWNGVTIIHDPNRALGPTTIYTTPTIADMFTDKLKQLASPTVSGQQYSEGSVRQITTQAQAGQLMAAATRHKNVSEETRQKLASFSIPVDRGDDPYSLPPVTHVQEGDWREFQEKYLCGPG